MVIYNITVQPVHAIAIDWLHWQQHVHIPEIMNTGLFVDFKLYQLLEVDEIDGPTFCIQFHASTFQDLQQYIYEFASSFQQKSFARWGDQFIAFRTIMETVK